MTAEMLTMVTLTEAQMAIQRAAAAVGTVTPCINDSGEKCKYADVKLGCTAKDLGGLTVGPSGIDCPRQLGTIRIEVKEGTIPIQLR